MVTDTVAAPEPGAVPVRVTAAVYVPAPSPVGFASTLITAGVLGVATALGGLTVSQLAGCPELGVTFAVNGSCPPPAFETVIVCAWAADDRAYGNDR